MAFGRVFPVDDSSNDMGLKHWLESCSEHHLEALNYPLAVARAPSWTKSRSKTGVGV